MSFSQGPSLITLKHHISISIITIIIITLQGCIFLHSLKHKMTLCCVWNSSSVTRHPGRQGPPLCPTPQNSGRP